MKIFIAKKITLVFILSLIPFLYLHCFLDSGDSGDSGAQNRLVRTVLVAGYYSTPSFIDVACYWKNGELIVLGDGVDSSHSYSIAVSGNNIYIAGYYTNSNLVQVACYWIDDVESRVDLGDGINSSYSTDIAVSGNNIYVSGYEASSGAFYWLINDNITRIDLNPNPMASASSIFVEGDNVYVLGVNASTEPCYWTNGVETILANADSASSIFVEGGNVYVSGVNSSFEPCYWTNNTATILTREGSFTYVNDIYVSGSDIYIAGSDYIGAIFTACYWGPDGTKTNFDSGTFGAWAESIFFFEGDIYISGYYYIDASNYTPCYWINTSDSRVDLSTDYGQGTSIWDPYL